jgi:hypothetical protein
MLALISRPCAVFLLLLAAGMLLLRRPSPAEWIVGLFGAATPFYFVAGVLFLTDDLPLFAKWAKASSFIRLKPVPHPLSVWIAIGAVVVYTAFGLLALQRSLGRTAISVRRSWSVMLIAIALAAVACGLLWKTNFMALLLVVVVIFCRYRFIS